MNLYDKREVSVKPEYDVVVVGGGIAGVAAAVAAARNGAKTILLEKQINLGGLATVGLISWYEPLCDGEGKQMIGGIAEELIKLSIKYGFENLPAKWGGEGKNEIHYDRYATRYSPTLFSLALDEFVTESGADIRFDTLATFPVMEGNICKGVIAESITGKEFFPAKIVIDATGDASVAHGAGIPTAEGENYLIYICHTYSQSGINEYNRTGDMAKLRRWSACGSDMYGNGHPEGMPRLYRSSAEAQNNYIMLGKRMMLGKYKSIDKHTRDIMMMPTMPQYRKIRHIRGEYVFNGSEDGRTFENTIGSCGDFRTPGRHFQIPYGCLYNKKFGNILVAGRIISAEDDGWEITRVIPVCALTGESAGVAASIAFKSKTDVGDVDIKELQKVLKRNNPFQ